MPLKLYNETEPLVGRNGETLQISDTVVLEGVLLNRFINDHNRPTGIEFTVTLPDGEVYKEVFLIPPCFVEKKENYLGRQ